MSEIVTSGIVDADVIEQLIDTYSDIVGEARIHFNDEGLHVRAVDAANIGMGITDVSAGAFESYDSPGSVTIGVNLHALADRLSVAGADDLVHLAVDMETRRLNVTIRNINQHIGLIDPEAIRSEPDTPTLDLPCYAVLEGADLKEAVTVAELVSDHVAIRAEPEDERVVFEARGDTDESMIEFGHDELIEGDFPGVNESLFSLDYLADMVNPIPDGSEVTIKFGDEFPMTMEWEASEGHQETLQYLAPRIQTR